LKLPYDNYIHELNNNNNQLDSSLSDDLPNEEYINNDTKSSSSIQKHQPHPPSAPISETSRRHRRRHQPVNEQPPPSQDNDQQQKYSENDLDSQQADSFNANGSFRRKSIFKSFKLKKEKIPLPRPSSASTDRHPDEKQQHRRNSRVASGTLRPARVNTFIQFTSKRNRHLMRNVFIYMN
jgi:hypothetical protein